MPSPYPSAKKSYPQRRYTPRPASAPRTVAQPLPPEPPARAPIEIVGDANLWQTLQRVTDPNSGWTKTTRAMQVPGGVLINTCSRKIGDALVAEALCLCPNARLVKEPDGKWRLQ